MTALVVFILDQVSKFAVVTYIQMGDRVQLFPTINLIHTTNRGAAFGMFHHSGAIFRLFFFGAVTVICLYMLLYWLGTTPQSEKLQRFCLALILGGAFGNLFDRMAYGEVTDFIDFYIGNYHWYTFNIADSAISVGVTLLLFTMLFGSKSKSKFDNKKSGK